MPEENFEEQARKLIEPFRMEPKPAVWQQVRASVAPSKRRRRALLWWWLLPLCVAGGLSIWMAHPTKLLKRNQPLANLGISQKNKLSNQQSAAKNRQQEKTLQTKSERKRRTFSQGLLQKNKDVIVAKKDLMSANKNEAKVYHQLRASQEKLSEENRQESKLNKSNDVVVTGKEQFLPSIEKGIKLHDKNDTTSLLISDFKDTLAAASDTVSNTIAVSNSAESAQKKTDTSTAVTIKKKKDKHNYSLGIQAELGTASLGSRLFGNTEKNAQLAGLSVPGSVFDLNNSVGNATVMKYSIKSGIDLSVGLSVKKALSKSIYINGGISYRYQQFGISQTIFKDTSNTNPTGASQGFYYYAQAKERLHFADIYTGIGWQIFHHSKTSFSLQAGVDNNLLFLVSQKQNGQPDTVTTLPIRNFYQWQPFVHLSLPFDWYVGKQTHFELSPFVRLGVRIFQKNSASYKDNHLASMGVQAIYFFK